MMTPPLEELLKKVDSKYTLVVAAAKRSRQLMEGHPKVVDTPSHKPVTIALLEINEGKVTVDMPETGPDRC
ncbi:MAG TPA: DNA-directed RNA polymerase subunit omega [Clostridiales bacterium]|nr:DNA-directed RNA polymerase subunit omega [Clostridiales bacterium]